MPGPGWTITFDCAEPAVAAAFWREALGYVDGTRPAGFPTWEEYLAGRRLSAHRGISTSLRVASDPSNAPDQRARVVMVEDRVLGPGSKGI
jgi:Glyoxalase-like domain